MGISNNISIIKRLFSSEVRCQKQFVRRLLSRECSNYSSRIFYDWCKLLGSFFKPVSSICYSYTVSSALESQVLPEFAGHCSSHEIRLQIFEPLNHLSSCGVLRQPDRVS